MGLTSVFRAPVSLSLPPMIFLFLFTPVSSVPSPLCFFLLLRTSIVVISTSILCWLEPVASCSLPHIPFVFSSYWSPPHFREFLRPDSQERQLGGTSPSFLPAKTYCRLLPSLGPELSRSDVSFWSVRMEESYPTMARLTPSRCYAEGSILQKEAMLAWGSRLDLTPNLGPRPESL